jgi:hypothetical protein
MAEEAVISYSYLIEDLGMRQVSATVVNTETEG